MTETRQRRGGTERRWWGRGWFSAVLAVVVLASASRGAAAAGPVELSDEPFRIDSVGLSVLLPLGSSAQSTRIGGSMSVQVTPEDSTWLMNIQTPQTANPETTVSEAVEQTIEQIKESYGGIAGTAPTRARLLDRTEQLVVNGENADRFYVLLPRGDGTNIVRGYTFFKPSETRFVVFEFITTEEEFRRVRSVYETSLATVKFVDPETAASSRRVALRAGEAFVSRLSPEVYGRVMGEGATWYRLYEPASSGNPADAKEIGYRSVEFWKGSRAEVSEHARGSGRVGGGEGYLARISVRILDGDRVVDTVGTYFMTPDRREETWSVRTAVRDPGRRDPFVWTETGVRMGRDLTVIVEQTGASSRTFKPFVPEEAYLSQFEVFLLPRLLVEAGVETEFGFYAYRTDSETVSLRRDEVLRDPAAAGAPTIVTRLRDDLEPQRSVFSESGRLVRTVLGDGRVWEPTTPEALFRLWERKGLPTGQGVRTGRGQR